VADPLFARPTTGQVEPAEAVKVVHEFLRKCRDWATEREIPARIERLQADPTPEQAAKLHAWTSWVAFVDHATRELEDGTLDHWFTGGGEL
jgi:hypothetical protein